MAESLNPLLNTGLRFHREGRLDEALGIYQQVVREEPGNARGRHLLGLVLRHRGDEAAANAQFERAVALAPDEALFRATLANSHRTLDRIDLARSELEALDTLAVDDPDLRIQIGTEWGLLGETARALDYCRPVLDMFPDHLKGNLLLGSLLHDTGEYQLAVEPLEKVRKADPNLPDPTCALVSTLFALGRYDRMLALAPPRDARQMFGEGTLKSVVLWLAGRNAEARQFAAAAREHGARLPDWPRKGVFLGMLDQLVGLIAFRESHAPVYQSAAHASLPVIGDEQAMAAAGYVLTLADRSTRLAAGPVFGCRARHLVGGPNRFRSAYLTALDRLADGDRFVSMIGSLDCRIGGMLAELPIDPMGRCSDFGPVDALAEDYVDWLAGIARERNLRAIVMGPPASNLQVDVMTVLARDAYLAIIERFNRALAAAARRHRLPFADLLAATRGRDGLGRATLYVDANYILPGAIAEALTASTMAPEGG